VCSGNGANAVPHYQKLYSRVNHIWINRKGQPILGAMERPRPGGTTLVIMVASEPGKYEFKCFFTYSNTLHKAEQYRQRVLKYLTHVQVIAHPFFRRLQLRTRAQYS